jgi:hypothetical protein
MVETEHQYSQFPFEVPRHVLGLQGSECGVLKPMSECILLA